MTEPNRAAQNRPTTGHGSALATSVGYAKSLLSSPVPTSAAAMTPGSTSSMGTIIFRKPEISTPFCPSFKFFAPSALWIRTWLVPQ